MTVTRESHSITGAGNHCLPIRPILTIQSDLNCEFYQLSGAVRAFTESEPDWDGHHSFWKGRLVERIAAIDKLRSELDEALEARANELSHP